MLPLNDCILPIWDINLDKIKVREAQERRVTSIPTFKKDASTTTTTMTSIMVTLLTQLLLKPCLLKGVKLSHRVNKKESEEREKVSSLLIL